jgi:Dynamin family
VEILRRGFFFVDTPGLGSAIFENSQTTEQYIPEIDVLILVTSYESPLTEDEIHFLRQASLSVRAVFIVVNKHDTASPETRQEILDYVASTVRSMLDGKTIKPFSVSARDGLAAKQVNDIEALKASGILDFEEELIRFLTRERSRLFFSGMVDRVSCAIESLPESERECLRAALDRLRDQNDPESSAVDGSPIVMQPARARIDERRVTPCEICRGTLHQLLNFFRQYQYDLVVRRETQEEHARAGGFCPTHTWQYERVASPRGICTAYPRLLRRMADSFRTLAANSSVRTSTGGLVNLSCPACKVRWDAEDRLVSTMAQKLKKNPESANAVSLCVPHLHLLLNSIKDSSIRPRLLLREAAVMERAAEDKQRCAIMHQSARRAFGQGNAHCFSCSPRTGRRLVRIPGAIRCIAGTHVERQGGRK